MRDHPVMAAHAATGLLYLQPLIAEDKGGSEAALSEPEFHVDINVHASNESGIVIPASSLPQDSFPEDHNQDETMRVDINPISTLFNQASVEQSLAHSIPLKDVEHLSSGMI